MKKIIPFKKDIIFKTNVSEITSISLEHTLHVEKSDLITGEFVVSGEYKMADSSINTEAFSFNLPFDISMDKKYILDNVIVDIDDFYYEIINNNVLSVNIEVLIDKLEEQPGLEEKQIVIDNLMIDDEPDVTGIEFEDLIEKKEDLEMDKNNMVKDRKAASVENNGVQKEESSVSRASNSKEESEISSARSIFDSFDSSRETYTTYKIYIVREGDNLEVILQKYGINKEEVEKYNDLKEIKIGDKIIIPSLVNAKD